MLNVSILFANVQPPVAPPEDPSGGVRAKVVHNQEKLTMVH